MEFDSLVDKIVVGVTALSVLIIALNLIFTFTGSQSPVQEMVDQGSQNTQSVDGNNSTNQKTPSYYEKASDNQNKKGDSSASSSDKQLNVSERAEIESSFEGYINNTERENGIYLDRKAVAGETNSIWVYHGGDPVQDAKVLVDGKSVGKTSRFGDVFFTVPNADRIVVRTTTENLGSVENTYRVY